MVYLLLLRAKIRFKTAASRSFDDWVKSGLEQRQAADLNSGLPLI